jgi:hypothetical protein
MNFNIKGRQYNVRYLVEQFVVEYNQAVREDRRLHCRWLPDVNEIPAKFFNEDSTMWVYFVKSWKAKGLNENQLNALKPVAGLNKTFAIQLVQKHLDSISFSLDHKIAGCAYLASLMFEELQ